MGLSLCNFGLISPVYLMNYSNGRTCIEVALEPENFQVPNNIYLMNYSNGRTCIEVALEPENFQVTNNVYLMNYSNGRTCIEVALEPENFLSIQLLIVYIVKEISKAEAWKLYWSKHWHNSCERHPKMTSRWISGAKK